MGIPGKIIEGDNARHDVMELDHAKLPDPVARAMSNLVDKLNRMGARMEEIEERQDCLEDKVSEHHPPEPEHLPATTTKS